MFPEECTFQKCKPFLHRINFITFGYLVQCVLSSKPKTTCQILDFSNFRYVLPPYTLVLCHTHVACRQDAKFTQANEFIPERWISEERDPEWNHQPGLVMPFGCGKRICPGKRLAEQEIHIVTAKIFKSFTMEPLDLMQVEFNWLMSPSGDLHFKLV